LYKGQGDAKDTRKMNTHFVVSFAKILTWACSFLQGW